MISISHVVGALIHPGIQGVKTTAIDFDGNADRCYRSVLLT